MAASIWVGNNADELVDTFKALNHLISHQNAAIDLIASDKRAALVTDMEALAELCKAGEILEVMDFGDQIAPDWVNGETHYNPEMNLCHAGPAELEDGEEIMGAFFEWDKTIPDGMRFDAQEAIYYFEGTETAGTYYIQIGKDYGTGWVAGKGIQFTLTEAPAAGDQLVISPPTNTDTDPTNGLTWNVYAKGGAEVKQTGTTSEGTSGTSLGSTHSTDVHATNGRVNAPSRVVYGYNRWSQSGIRQWLNSAAPAGEWWTPQNDWDRPHEAAATKAGFLAGYDEAVRRFFMPIKVVTVAGNADNNAEDVTYDKVFLSALEQMYCVPQFSGKEGEYWGYYKRLLDRTSPASIGQTYARLIKYALNAPTSPQYCFRRSAYRYDAHSVWCIYTSGRVNTSSAYGAYRCAPSVFISK